MNVSVMQRTLDVWRHFIFDLKIYFYFWILIIHAWNFLFPQHGWEQRKDSQKKANEWEKHLPRCEAGLLQKDTEGHSRTMCVCLPWLGCAKGLCVPGAAQAQPFPRSPRCPQLTEALGPLHKKLSCSEVEEILLNGPYYSFLPKNLCEIYVCPINWLNNCYREITENESLFGIS